MCVCVCEALAPRKEEKRLCSNDLAALGEGIGSVCIFTANKKMLKRHVSRVKLQEMRLKKNGG